jgi:hypothetical protein
VTYLSRMCVECGKDVLLRDAELLPNGQRVCKKRCAKRRERRKAKGKDVRGQHGREGGMR